ncbi:MAG: bifunctional 3,4-dihydroxy-2-butanone 4-phosphate synthase/GTP cyclohydrolase II [Gammaproteobacteria bacterium RIFCSPHIGHO2_12_FULL_35_23]|nr:MAG: bifunctional 3,4-dihydroxy-2-butanone 4-phosphate synthase/GTP cyclohydrolase II [Gammaproteobacteria bacterium RIFCSPHIGHO2_12_FULL_35_23]
MPNQFNNLQQALSALKKGKMIIVVDEEERENEGDLVIAAEFITPEAMNFMIRHTSGVVCLVLTQERVNQLRLPLMVTENTNGYHTNFTVSIEAREGVTTGVSAKDRVRTIQVAIDSQSSAEDLARPGHVFPLCAKNFGVLEREGHTEGSIDLMRLAGLIPAAVICEVMNLDGSMARLSDLHVLAKTYQMPIVSIKEIKQYRLQHENIIELISVANLPIAELGSFKIKIFRDLIKKEEQVVLQHGETQAKSSTLVRIHSTCLTGDVFSSLRCDCGWQLQESLRRLAREDGLIIYLAQEGRGIGLANKIKAYALQETGLDTVEANRCLGFADDLRNYSMAAQILRYLQVKKVRLLTNNPSKINALIYNGLEVERVPLIMPACPENSAYLATKRNKLGHLLEVTETT